MHHHHRLAVIGGIGILIFAGAIAILFPRIAHSPQKPQEQEQQIDITRVENDESTIASNSAEYQVVQIVNYGVGRDTQRETTTIKSGQTALDLLRFTHEVRVVETDSGIQVDSIDQYANGDDGKTWSFTINGIQEDITAEQYLLQVDDVIEWEFGSE